jgi:hypothetical protein
MIPDEAPVILLLEHRKYEDISSETGRVCSRVKLRTTSFQEKKKYNSSTNLVNMFLV